MAYLGVLDLDKSEKIDKIYFLFKDIKLDESFLNLNFKKHSSHENDRKKYILYELPITDDQYNNIVKPFILGKYSKIDKNYVNEWFGYGMKKLGNQLEINDPRRKYAVLANSQRYREKLSEVLNVRSSLINELEGIPSLHEEVFLYCNKKEKDLNIIFKNKNNIINKGTTEYLLQDSLVDTNPIKALCGISNYDLMINDKLEKYKNILKQY